MSRAIAQIILFLDPETQEFRAEMGSPNGSRRKIDLPEDQSLWGDLIGVELLELNSWLRDQEKRKQEQEEIAKIALRASTQRFKHSHHFEDSNIEASPDTHAFREAVNRCNTLDVAAILGEE